MSMNIAIDGPAGAGKSTIAKKLAKQLGFIYVDTGAMYRAMAYYFIQNGIKADDVLAIEKACVDVDVTITYKDGEQQVILNGENVNGFIRTPEAGNMASAVSVYSKVRAKMVELQQALASMHHGAKSLGWNLRHHHAYYGTKHGVGEQTVVCCRQFFGFERTHVLEFFRNHKFCLVWFVL